MTHSSRIVLSAAALLLLASPSLAASGRGHWGETQAMRIQIGSFEPRGESTYWDDKALDFTGSPADFDDTSVGISYVRFLGERLGVVISGNFFDGQSSQHYLDFVDEFGNEIVHDTELETANFTVGLLLHLTRRDAAIVPYVGGGGGFYFWNLTEFGDFIDFDQGAEIFYGEFEDDGSTFGWYVHAGIEVPIGPNWSLYGDVRRERADDELAGDFAGFGDLDLSGRAYSIGASFSF